MAKSHHPDTAMALTGREKDICRYIEKNPNRTARQGAIDLNMGLHTYRQHTKSIRIKLGVTSTTEAVKLAREKGLLY